MNAEFYGYIVYGIVISGAGMTLCSLIGTIVLTSIQRPRLYQLLRCGMTTAGFALSTFLLAIWIIFSILFESTLSSAEIQTLWIGIACYSIPMSMGVIAAIGPKYPVILWMGRFIMCIVTPFAAAWVAKIPAFDTHGAEPVFWLLLYIVVTTIWWEVLIHWDRKLQKKRELIGAI